MLMHDGICPGLLLPLVDPAVRQAPLAKYQLLVVVAPVKSSATVFCDSAAPDQAALNAATMAATEKRVELILFITILRRCRRYRRLQQCFRRRQLPCWSVHNHRHR